MLIKLIKIKCKGFKDIMNLILRIFTWVCIIALALSMIGIVPLLILNLVLFGLDCDEDFIRWLKG